MTDMAEQGTWIENMEKNRDKQKNSCLQTVDVGCSFLYDIVYMRRRVFCDYY